MKQRTPLHYARPDAAMTVGEALEEYRASIDDLVVGDAVDPETAAFLARHDVAHVVFGCGTSIGDELVVDIWTVYGTDVGLARYNDYSKLGPIVDLYEKYNTWSSLWASIIAVPKVVRAYLRGRSMKQKLRWDALPELLDERLDRLRADFGIRVLGASTTH